MKNYLHKLLIVTFLSILSTSLIRSQNNSLNFDGDNGSNGLGDYVDCKNILPLSYTKEAWIYITNLAKYNNIISGDGGALHAFWAPSNISTAKPKRRWWWKLTTRTKRRT